MLKEHLKNTGIINPFLCFVRMRRNLFYLGEGNQVSIRE